MNFRGVFFVFLSIFPVFAWSVVADDSLTEIIEEVQYNVNKNDQAVIEIRFKIPIRLVQSKVADRGTRAETRVEFFISPAQKKLLPLEEVRLGEKDEEIPLQSVTYDGFNANDPVIRINFDKAVAYEIRQLGSDALLVTLPEIKPEYTPMNLVSQEEMQRVQERLRQMRPAIEKATKPAPTKPAELPPAISIAGKPSSARDKAVEKIMVNARTALTRGEIQKAIDILNSVLAKQDHAFVAEAYELLGLAREREGKIDFAKRIYAEYLALYPKGEGHERVKQRLADLAPPVVQTAGTLKTTSRSSAKGTLSNAFGSVSLFNFRGEQSGSDKIIDTFQSYINFSSRVRGPRFDFRTIANGTATDRLVTDPNDSDNQIRDRALEASKMYVELKDSQTAYSMRLGRQSGGSGGVFGKFDGLLLGYDYSEKARLAGAYGYTVDFNEKGTISTNTPFVSAGLGLGSYFQYLDVTPYAFAQQIDGINNRTAAGVETRWNHPKFSFINTMDYETSYGVWNLESFNSTYRMSPETTINFNADIRRSPMLAVENALNSDTLKSCSPAGDDSIKDALAGGCTENQIRDVAEKQTGSSRFMTLALNQRLTEDTQFNTDISVVKTHIQNLVPLVDDPTKFEETQEDFDQISGSVQFVVNRIFQTRDSNLIGVRYTDDQTFSAVTLSLSNRLAIYQSWNLSMQLLAERRANIVDPNAALPNPDFWRYQPDIRLEYRFKQLFELQAEVFFDATEYDDKTKSEIQLITLGARYNF